MNQSAYAQLRWMEQPGNLASVVGDAATGDDAPAAAAPRDARDLIDKRALRVLDLSAGTGAVGAVCALAGMDVVATDIAQQLPLLESNARRVRAQMAAAGAGGDAGRRVGSFVARKFAWGDDVSELGAFDLILCSDSLYISVRDGIEELLVDCLVDLVNGCLRPGSALLFVFEERTTEKEAAALALLKGRVLVEEVDAATLDVSDAKAEDDESGLDALFWEPPPVRMLILRPVGDVAEKGGHP